MVGNNTVIVIGAGASKEANLPTGVELKQRIINILNFDFDITRLLKSGDPRVYEALRLMVRQGTPESSSMSQLIEAALRIRDALPVAMSIDSFIENHKGNKAIETCGKLSIVRSILEAERKSLLFVDAGGASRTLDLHGFKNTWFEPFLQLLTERCVAEKLKDRLSNIRLIIFNYDRCVEQFLYHALQIYYGISPGEAGELICGMEIYHPYGKVGELPWYGKKDAIEFGAEPDAKDLVKLANKIKTYTEGTNPESSDILKIREGMKDADFVIFLGYAFHIQNLDLIYPAEGKHINAGNVCYFATAKSISSHDRGVVVKELVKRGGANRENIILVDNTCFELFRKHWRSLSI
ncbi:MAG: hypothetical protein KJ970_19655 [Candidatus Eisenbacteria bacterium]|uniref:SIR2-like domain-containing protein n=1 Tax=Eiseniibacteriota bacterium TaxID=2212470 RepID=A0A948S3I5_UNCEI|nr:hypothetical protein [Candidatus Eisenbacteria bacterium]MBU1949291.1 hypothetical protein [Candidatus Eisenbacteria bacterium]MBU2693139.1 hypothetical protein [Candidatus Eisenbacteria bacterium]